jgi:S-methylmethionine-dependent homocysteine/selenocysteine methylase
VFQSPADTQADLITAMTLTDTDEAIGIARAAPDVEMPVALSFTLGTGRNPARRQNPRGGHSEVERWPAHG